MPYADPAVQRQYQRERRAACRAEWFSGKYCVECGSTEELRLDHIDPRTKVSHKIWSWSAARRAVELEKCQALCEPCHKKKNLLDLVLLGKATDHGKVRMYRKGCKCGPCKAAKAEENRKHRPSLQRKSEELTPRRVGP